jgi:hypothetical protein
MKINLIYGISHEQGKILIENVRINIELNKANSKIGKAIPKIS